MGWIACALTRCGCVCWLVGLLVRCKHVSHGSLLLDDQSVDVVHGTGQSFYTAGWVCRFMAIGWNGAVFWNSAIVLASPGDVSVLHGCLLPVRVDGLCRCCGVVDHGAVSVGISGHSPAYPLVPLWTGHT